MHSRKSILKKSITFIMSIFAFAIFSTSKVNAESCEVKFKDNNPYLVIGGEASTWNDEGLEISEDCTSWSNIEVTSLVVNGKAETGTLFTSDRAAGHYTIEYKYSYLASGVKETGSIYRYLRILNSSMDTSSNYTLGTFNLTGNKKSEVIKSIYIADNYFASFINASDYSETSLVTSTQSYVVVKDSLGRTVASEKIMAGGKDVVLSRVEKQGDNYYLIGKNSEDKGVLIILVITKNSNNIVIAHSKTVFPNENKEYSDLYIKDEIVYLVGKTETGYPVIETFNTENDTFIVKYTHNVKGSYKGVTVANQTIYAVGYTQSDTAQVTLDGLYTYLGNDNVSYSPNISLNISGNNGNTIFNDIVYDTISGQNIIVGESSANEIYANNVIASSNKRQGYSDGIVIRVNIDGKSVTGAYMLGGPVNDTINSIEKLTNNQYILTGTMSDGASSLVYKLTSSSSAIEVEEDASVSGSSDYKINGLIEWNYGYQYYGSLSADTILGVYNPETLKENGNAFILILDNRKFEDYETINLVKDTEVKYCEKKIKFNNSEYGSKDCEDDPDSNIDTSTLGTSKTIYEISLISGGKIYIYRKIMINQAPTPYNLTNSYTGVLKWYVYNRSYVYINDNSTRYQTTDFNYKFNGSVHKNETIEDMIDKYFETGNSSGYSLSYVNDISSVDTYKTFTKSDQTSAAFSSIEMAKKYAYYQEFSRIIKLDNYDETKMNRYTGQTIVAGSTYYVYYIDYKGNTSETQVSNCQVTTSYITNCSAKNGYAFSSLDAIKGVIENFLIYNNYFVSTRNTIYNKSVEVSEINRYKQEMTTTEYLSSTYFNNKGTQLNFNVSKYAYDETTNQYVKTLIYTGTDKNVYFGGSVNGTTFTHSLLANTQTVSSNENNGVTYYSNSNYVFFEKNMCYSVYYSYGDVEGTSKEFCLDTTPPVIVYKKVNSQTEYRHYSTDVKGTTAANPLYIEDAFQIIDLEDLDDYAFIYINGNRYIKTCDNSETCKEDFKKYIQQSFEYNAKDIRTPQVIEFSDRLLNTIKFYFIVGTESPIFEITNESDNGFTLVLDFKNTNPIVAIDVGIYQQGCSGDASSNCYTPNTSDETTMKNENAITNYKNDFIEALRNYIYAVGYRDNTSEVKETVTILAQDGVYKIGDISYIIDNGYFLETEGYQESYVINEDNIFSYNGAKYRYNELTNTIQEVVLNEDDEYVSTETPSITLLNGVFKFASNGKEYTINNGETKTVEALAKKYEIVDNKFKIEEIEYELSLEEGKESVSYKNPVIDEMKHLELTFERTIVTSDGLEGGVSIPKTQPVKDVAIDSYTGLPAYEIVEEEYLHFNLVDGVYSFTVSQNFYPYTDTKETKINVKSLDLKIGYAPSKEGLEVVKNKMLDFVNNAETSSTLPITEITGERIYPLDVGNVYTDSNLERYSDTQFVNRTIYTSYEMGTEGVFIIDVFTDTNEYGLPKDNTSSCKTIVIYANNFTSNPLPVSELECELISETKFDNINVTLLESYGIHTVLSNQTAFAFNKENTLYRITLRGYALDDSGSYISSATKISKMFYLDSFGPDDNDGIHQKSVTPYVYEEGSSSALSTVNFNLTNGVYVLSRSVGDITNVSFKISFKESNEGNDYRENKLLLVDITQGETSVTCNLYNALTNDSSEESLSKKCRELFDTSKSDASVIVFSQTGDYKIKFYDPSGNSVSYSFVIDKSAPTVELNAVTVIKNGVETALFSDKTENKYEYYILDYVKNPVSKFILRDLTSINQYKYYFVYNGTTYTTHTVLTSNSNNATIQFDDDLINNLNGIDDLVTLYIWAIDELNNNGESNPTKVYYWVDYLGPELTFNTDNLNKTQADVSNDAELTKKTISIRSGDYSGRNIICSEEGFSFSDIRGENTTYTFKTNCNDNHNDAAAFPSQYESFDKTVYLKFYESDGTSKIDEEFNFSLPTNNLITRWIYITAQDALGNESNNYIILPILIYDDVNPFVIKAEDSDGRVLNPEIYQYVNNISGKVYLSNKNITITINEPISVVSLCQVMISPNSSELGSCDEVNFGVNPNKEYSYSERKITFEFNFSEDNKSKVIVFKVKDFAGLESETIVVVIDKIKPEIEFNEGKEENDTIEYIESSKVYGDAYINGGFSSDVHASDDQKTDVSVVVKYALYEPKVTYNNYVYKINKYEKVDNGLNREINTKYYLLMKKEALNNKECVASTKIEGIDYCYIEDIQGYNYFDSNLNDETGNFFKELTTQIDSSKIGVYRISYYAIDKAGNYSETTIYKKVFVSDTKAPDIELTISGNTYRNVASSNNDNFEGKANSDVTFKGKDTSGDTNTRIVLYRCSISDYENNTCNIDQELFTPSSDILLKGESTSNVYTLKVKSKGVYKVFVYDRGQYKKDNNVIYYNNSLETDSVYSLTYNDSYFYMATINESINASYVINGNKYTSDYNSNNSIGIYYSESKINYYTARNGSLASDVILKKYDYSLGKYVDISGGNAIGYAGNVSFEIDNDLIIINYKDSEGRIIYSVTYKKYSVANGLYIHQTYHNINTDTNTVEVCVYENGRNKCRDLEYVYQVTKVEANIYIEGNYEIAFSDRYGNLSNRFEFSVDNTPYTENRDNNMATGINYWFSVPSQIINSRNTSYFINIKNKNQESINPLDSVYEGNFNSNFFYAFASKSDAIAYLTTIYSRDFDNKVGSSGISYTYYTIDGEPYNTTNKNDVLAYVKNNLVFTTYAKDKKFSDPAIKQVAYTGSDVELSSSMYKYAYLLVKKQVTNGEIKYSYTNKGNSCTASDNEECIKVDLKIVSASSSINLNYNNTVNDLICRVTNTGGSSELSGTACNFNVVTSDATYLFIDSDVNKYHTNTVYYGITAYSNAPQVEFNELGKYIPLSKFTRYNKQGNEYEKDVNGNGNYIWLDSNWVNLDTIRNTNLLTACKYNNIQETECVYTTYFSRYDATQKPNSGYGDTYYDYSDGKYSDKDELMNNYRYHFTFDQYGKIDYGNTTSIAISINSNTINTSLNDNLILRTNKTAYLKLFDNNNISSFFEISAIKNGDEYIEVYSYVTLIINGEYKNINDYIHIYKVNNKNTAYECILYIGYETSYDITIIDRAGNTITMKITQSNIIPTITYQKENEENTYSNVQIAINTSSSIANLTKNNTVTYKYNETTRVYEQEFNNICISYLETVGNTDTVKNLTLQYLYNADYDCKGIYRVYTKDNHGNSIYKDFVFNPYNLVTNYDISSSTRNYEYQENEINGLIVNNGFSISVNADLNYIVINKYDAYSNLNLKNENKLEITDFTKNYTFTGTTCIVTITPINNMYTVSISGDNHSCDGIYTIDVYNRFSKTISESEEFNILEGADTEIASYRVSYNSSSTIEIDTTAPDSTSHSYFAIYVDNEESQTDTNDLVTDKVINYTNNYIKIVWGGTEAHSFAYLKYRNDGETWISAEVNSEVTYAKSQTQTPYSKEFKYVTKGVYTIEFIFEDAVGNSNSDNIFTLIITIEPPNVAFFEISDSNVIGRRYEDNERIAKQTILQCIYKDGSGENNRNCEYNTYSYAISVNGVQLAGEALSRFSSQVSSTISTKSGWFQNGGFDLSVKEYHLQLKVSINNKDEIYTIINIIIDNKAPIINIDKQPYPSTSTYTGTIYVSLESEDDTSNKASIYKCDVIEEDVCKVYNDKDLVNSELLLGTIEYNEMFAISDSGYFMIIASDDLGNTSSRWIVIDNDAPTLSIEAGNSNITSGMYTNAQIVYATVKDKLSEINSSFKTLFIPFEGYQIVNGSLQATEISYDSLIGFTQEGKYIVTPVDGVGNEGRAITFYIYRQTPSVIVNFEDIINESKNNVANNALFDTILVNLKGQNNLVTNHVSITWKDYSSNSDDKKYYELYAPIVSVTYNGKQYDSEYNEQYEVVVGKKITTRGEHTFVITDAAGNRKVLMVTVNDTSSVCINGKVISVKLQGYYSVDSLLIGGDFEYAKDDVIIFALPSQSSSKECNSQDLLKYRTLYPKNSYYLVSTERNAELMSGNQYDFVEYGFISKAAIEEIKNVGGTVVAFVVTKDIANDELGYRIGTNFFSEDPIGWTMIFVSALSLIWPAIRIFVKKKVKVY